MRDRFKRNCIRTAFSLLMATSASWGTDDSTAVNEQPGSNKRPIALNNKLHPIALDGNLGNSEEKTNEKRDKVYEEMCRIDDHLDSEFGYYFAPRSILFEEDARMSFNSNNNSNKDSITE